MSFKDNAYWAIVGMLAGASLYAFFHGAEARLEKKRTGLEQAIVAEQAIQENIQKRMNTVQVEPQVLQQVPKKYDETEVQELAKTIFGEARGASDELKIAIAYVILNRAEHDKKTISEIVHQPYQFSCWNKNDPNYPLLSEPEKHDKKAWQECLETARGVLEKRYENPIGRARWYHAERGAGNKPCKPKWAEGQTPVKKIGNTYFYNTIKKK